MGTVFKRGETWVIEYKKQNGNLSESVGKSGVLIKTKAREFLRNREKQIKLGKYEMIGGDGWI